MEPDYLVYPIGTKTEYLKLRDTFAAAALTGLLAQEYCHPKTAAEGAYEYADAMLAARAKQT